MLILVINCGSSSVKYQLCDMKTSEPLARGIVERIGQRDSMLKHQSNGKEMFLKKIACRDHERAIETIAGILTDRHHGVISSKDQISGIGHRAVHGGEEIKESVLINKKVVDIITKYCELAPLHNPPSLLGIKGCRKIFAGTPQAAVFDTAFHQTMPQKAYIYGLPYEYYTKHKIRRYGFHGTSHRFVAEKTAGILRKKISRLKIITCHLGNGCSMSAVAKGKSIDTSMGLTPLEGLVMGTRCGDIDPAIVTYLVEKKRMTFEDVNRLLNKKSGLLGISGVSNDMRDINKAIKKGSKRARLAKEIFIYRIEKYIGAYIAAMDGCDAVVFTAGIGENQPDIVDTVRKDLGNILNRLKTKVIVVPTNEELLIARDTYRIITRNNKA